ncbi:helix-turn-helix domain-containing protein [Lactococcus lactis]|uniref:Transcription regulator n=1 Tax=Lactococcus lactis subsp. lactis TaxID=1360 RepID=A0A0V8E3B8_LACLL|nr:Rgg/GadR/MutR family transcriptional regulator [Lactococcus lactis]KSU20252.1 transcription regulator [Lactococcus lactis subsp. lactis]
MMYKKYGKVFKKLRLQKNFNLSEFERCGINKSIISRFETGKTMISFENLYMALTELNISLAEYDRALNNFSADDVNIIIDKILNAERKQEVFKLKQLYNTCINENLFMLSIAVKSKFNILSISEIDTLRILLFDVEIWGYYELSVFFLTLEEFNEPYILQTIKRIIHQNNHINFIEFSYKRRLFEILYKASAFFSTRGDERSARFLLDTYSIEEIGDDLYINNIRNITIGVYLYYFKNKEFGKKRIVSALNIFKELNQEVYFKYYKKKIAEILE